ncbi:MAG TPA: dihydrolipoyl dehydrogenase [Gammaproteobacteria bacterium]
MNEAAEYDLLVIGAGPGGYIAAIRAAQLGMRVACVEKDPTLGGTCLNIGCIPSKALLHSSQRFSELRSGLDEHGIVATDVSLDLERMMQRKLGVVATLTKGIAGLFKKNGIDWLAGSASFEEPGAVRIDGSEARIVRASRVLIATGSAPIELSSLPFDGNRVVSSTEALAFTTTPKRLLVVGAGAIGLELGSVWSRLGSEVTVVEYMDQIVPGADGDAARALMRALGKQGLRISLSTTAVSGAESEDGFAVTLEDKDGSRTAVFDKVLVAVGRRAYTDGLGLERIGIETDERGRIPVDAHYATRCEGVHAIGDVIEGPMLAHKAEDEGVVAVERMAGVAGHVNYDAIPSVVYTHPELASVGLSEARAVELGHDVRVGTFPLSANSRARCTGETEGLVKIVADATDDRVLGIHIVATAASEMIAEAAVAMEFQASAEDIARSTHAHPTLAEAIKEAALAVDGRALNA